MWPFIIGVVLAIGAMYALTPKPQNQPPAGLDDLEVPTAEEGKEIPVLFGTRELKGANVVWYGDLNTKAIKAKGGKK
ncbi:MAG TPA: hypothetical protein PLZ16_00365 [Gammaproteobacteria bacterium]|nr:hypothetical protein [Gammaproteobacteria bacterium]